MPEPLVLSADPEPGTRLLVTGGARGIGRAVADAYAARGGRICILDRDPVADAPSGWLCLQGSAAIGADIEKAFVAMDRAWGGVDVAHANAGMSANMPSLELTETEWHAVLDLNLTGVFLTAQAAARRMVAAGSGVILATSSIYGITAGANRAAYTATNGAVSNLGGHRRDGLLPRFAGGRMDQWRDHVGGWRLARQWRPVDRLTDDGALLKMPAT
jgi:NAD(P)-dependent dehydrogenase (short-subunit alcohol dehydrogenase family)